MKIGFIGLGVMGKPMAKNLARAGYELVVYDINEDAVDSMIEYGCEAGHSCRDVGRRCDIIITMLPDSPEVKKAVLGPEGVLEGAKSPSVLIDMSSIAPLTSREIYLACQQAGIDMLDCPVSGGETRAIDGTLSIMAGGKAEVFERVRDILCIMGTSVTRLGEIGAGNTAKLASQIVVAANIAAVSEALVLGKLAGVAPEMIYQSMRASLAGSTVMDAKAPMMMDGNFNPGFRVAFHIKDLANAIETGHSLGAPLPLTTSVMEMMQWLKANGCGGEDQSAVVKYYERLADTDVRR